MERIYQQKGVFAWLVDILVVFARQMAEVAGELGVEAGDGQIMLADE